MNLNHLPDQTRIWIYQADRELTTSERQLVELEMKPFIDQWAAHGQPLSAGFEVRNNRWLIVGVDEVQAGASGCSIDASVHRIKAIGERIGVDFFNRTLVIWDDHGTQKCDPMHDFWARRKAGIVTDETPVFNNLARTLGELKKGEMVPFKESWHAEMWR